MGHDLLKIKPRPTDDTLFSFFKAQVENSEKFKLTITTDLMTCQMQNIKESYEQLRMMVIKFWEQNNNPAIVMNRWTVMIMDPEVVQQTVVE